jgi:hypothetical protein
MTQSVAMRAIGKLAATVTRARSAGNRWLFAVAVLTLTAGCTRRDPASSLGVERSAVTTGDVFGFETQGSWSTTTANVTLT